MKFFRSIWIACVWLVRGVGTLILWSVWLGLVALLGLQAYVASTSELTVPDFVLRRFERQIAESGIRVSFGRTSFDPTGRVLLEDARLSLPEYAEPVVTARAIYVQLNPWSLAVGQFEPRELRIMGASAAVPAILSPSGRAEEIIRDLDATISPTGKELAIAQLTARVAGITISAHGAIALPHVGPGQSRESLAGTISARFPALCRQALTITGQLEALETPALDLEFEPSVTRLAMVNATLFARSLTLDTPLAAHISGLHIVTRLPLISEALATLQLELTADDVRLPLATSARAVHALMFGQFLPGGFAFAPRELQLTTDHVETSGFTADALSAQLFPRPLPRLDAEVVAQILGAPLAVRASADFSKRSATLRFRGDISPRILDPLSQRLGAMVQQYFDFDALHCDDGEARLGAGWKFEKLTANIAVRGIRAYHVFMDEGRAAIELDPQRLYSPDAYGRIGENFARGSYEHDLRTQQYRFLLAGRLRPLDISAWFHGDWWPNFFRQFEFPTTPPFASVDVRGFWRDGRQSSEFVFADAPAPVIRGVALDRVRTRLFIRHAFYDGLELLATRSTGAARGTFRYIVDPESFNWRTLEIEVASTLDPALAAQILGPTGQSILAPFKYAQPPTLALKGQFSGTAAPGGAHQSVQLETNAPGKFRFFDFPLDDVSFAATVHDNDIIVENVKAAFAGGTVTGHAKVSGEGSDRRVAFAASLKDGSLGLAAAAVQSYTAESKHQPPAPPGKFLREKANVRLDLAASAEGRSGDAFSYHGDGTASLQGAEIGEVSLFGALSELLKFTALRFTSAKANFKIDGAKLTFPEVTLRGANSAVDAHGDYALDRSELDFKAKIFPFQESASLIKSVVGAVLTPISNVFEVKLSGTLEKPEWAFVIGPTNFLHSLAPTGSDPAAKPGDASPGNAPREKPMAEPEPGTPPASPGEPVSSPKP